MNPGRAFVYGLFGLVWIGYFGLSSLEVTPNNPLRADAKHVLNGFERFFEQGWGVFAPPPVAGYNLVVQCISDDKPASETYADLTQAASSMALRHPFSGWNLVSGSLTTGLLDYIVSSNNENVAAEACQRSQDPQSQACQQRELIRKEREDVALSELIRVTSSYCMSREAAGSVSYDQARLLVAVTPVPPWAERYGAPSPSRIKPMFYDLGIHPLDPQVKVPWPTLPSQEVSSAN